MNNPGKVDLLVIGGGINGAGVARDAAGRGLSVALCEQGDFAGATSSASTKLIHGGLRYLEYREFGLVAKALAEREHVLRIAPHIAWPLRFVMPHVPSLRPRWMIRLGLWLYDHLGGRISLPRSNALRLDALPAAGGLRKELVHGFAYSDAWVDDARLVVLNLLAAQAEGASILARTRLVAATRRDGAWHCTLEDVASGARRALVATALVNAAGPWVAQVDRLLAAPAAGEQPPAAVKLVRGSHIVVRRRYEGEHAYILQNADRRIVFLIPYEGEYTLIGTTDVSEPDIAKAAQVSAEEERYLLDAANAYLAEPVGADDIVWRYAGVRPLVDDDAANPSAVTRDYRLVLDAAQRIPCVSIYGGKITTYRHLAEDVLALLAPWTARAWRGAWTAKKALPGGAFPRERRGAELQRLHAAYPQLAPALLDRLFARHGLNAHRLLGDARTPADLGRDFGGGLTEREAEHCIAHEWAHAPDDILWRRTKCGLHMSERQRAAFADWFAARTTQPQPHDRLAATDLT